MILWFELILNKNKNVQHVPISELKNQGRPGEKNSADLPVLPFYQIKYIFSYLEYKQKSQMHRSQRLEDFLHHVLLSSLSKITPINLTSSLINTWPTRRLTPLHNLISFHLISPKDYCLKDLSTVAETDFFQKKIASSVFLGQPNSQNLQIRASSLPIKWINLGSLDKTWPIFLIVCPSRKKIGKKSVTVPWASNREQTKFFEDSRVTREGGKKPWS